MTHVLLRLPLAAALAFFCGSASAWAAEAIPTAQLPAKLVLATRQITVEADGSWTAVTHSETKILLQNAIAALGQPALSYSDILQQVDVTDAYTLKANGEKIPVAPDAILIRQSPASANSPLLSDQKQKVIIFPNVEVGDTLVFNATAKTKPLIPGSFTYDMVFSPAVLIENETTTLSLPKAMAANVEMHGLTAAKSAQDDRIVYTIHYSNPQPVQASQTQSGFDVGPRFSLSSFKDYDAFAATYAGLALPMMAVTPAIQAKADEITAGVTDRREQARKIYDWVSAHVRYIALEFGQGGIVPHGADHTLAVAYGDCKDHAVLFAALLKAKGIDSNLVLINAGNSFTTAKVAALAPFNHMITWLPEFHLYADTTNGRVVPFGLLPMSEYGKPVVHVADRTGALHTIPLTDPAVSSDAYKLVMVSDDPGHIVSNSSITGTGNFAATLRLFGVLMQGQDGAKIAGNILQKSRTPRATGALTAPPPDVNAPSYQISANYSTPGVVGGLARDTGVPLSDNLRVVGPFSAAFFGPLLDNKDRDEATVPCYNGHASDDESLQFPATRHLSRLPGDSKVSGAHVTYISHWSSDGNSVSVHRELTTHFDQALCSGSAKEELQAAADRIRTDADTLVQLPRVTGEPTDVPPAAP